MVSANSTWSISKPRAANSSGFGSASRVTRSAREPSGRCAGPSRRRPSRGRSSSRPKASRSSWAGAAGLEEGGISAAVEAAWARRGKAAASASLVRIRHVTGL
ncbi:MAG: hypothetical protein AAB576_01815, partial [Elusimicrobiota bacterium]